MLAILLGERGDITPAEQLFRRAIEIDEKALGPDHATTRHIQANLNGLLESQKKMEK
jgi:Tetratricopeptide repeat